MDIPKHLSAHGRVGLLVLSVVALALGAATVSASGRWKFDNNQVCVFDANDSGPDQCAPPAPTTMGRWKVTATDHPDGGSWMH